MADEIYFYDQFHGETPAGTKIHFSELTLYPQYPLEPEFQVRTSNVGTVDPTVINQLTAFIEHPTSESPLPHDLTLDNNIWGLGELTFQDLMNILPEVYDTVTLIDFTYGINKETQKRLHWCLDLQLTSITRLSDQRIVNCSYSYVSYLKYTQPEQSDVTHILKNGTINIAGPGAGAGTTRFDRMTFGILFMYPFDRLVTVDNAILLFLIGAANDSSEADYLTIPITGYHTGEAVFDYSLINVYTRITNPWYDAFLIGAVDMSNLSLVGMEPADEVFSPEAGPSSDEGGYHGDDSGDSSGAFDDSSDTIGVPNLPTLGASNLGFINVYEVTAGSLQLFANELFPPLTYTPPTQITATDVTDAIVAAANQFIDVLNYIPDFFNQINAEKYINYVLDCHIIPVDPGSGTPNTAIQVGNKTLLSYGEKLSSDYVEVNCGTISLKEYYANFADFLTSFKLFLPFVGFVPAHAEWFYRESLQVIYHFNILDGSFIAYVLSTGAYVNNNNSGRTILGQYAGNCCVHIPITGQTYANMVNTVVGSGFQAVKGLTSALSGAVGSALSKDPLGVADSAISGAGSLANSMLATAAAKPDVVSSNQYSASAAFLSCRRPFVMIERPVSSFPTTFAKENGVPSNVSKKLGNVTGFNIIGNLHLDGINATEAEKDEIESLLKSGVIL